MANGPRYERLAGQVSGMGTAAGREDFVFRSGDHAIGAATATGLAIDGLAGAAASAAASSGDATDPVMNFRCRVGQHLVTGCLGSAGFADGDHVVVVGQRQGDTFVAAAVARPADRTLWLPPHAGRGHRAFRRALLTHWGIPSVLGPLAFSWWMDASHEQPLGWYGPGGWLVTGLICSAILLLVIGLTAWRVYPYARLSTAIFETLELPDASRISLPRTTRRYLRDNPADVRRFHPFTPWVFRY